VLINITQRDLIGRMKALNKAINVLGGATALAAALGVRQSAVSNWLIRGVVPADKCLPIQRATKDEVTCYELRPDIFPAPEEAA